MLWCRARTGSANLSLFLPELCEKNGFLWNPSLIRALNEKRREYIGENRRGFERSGVDERLPRRGYQGVRNTGQTVSGCDRELRVPVPWQLRGRDRYSAGNVHAAV